MILSILLYIWTSCGIFYFLAQENKKTKNWKQTFKNKKVLVYFQIFFTFVLYLYIINNYDNPAKFWGKLEYFLEFFVAMIFFLTVGFVLVKGYGKFNYIFIVIGSLYIIIGLSITYIFGRESISIFGFALYFFGLCLIAIQILFWIYKLWSKWIKRL